MVEYYSLEHAKKTFKSKTKPYPFLIAHECYEPYTDNVTKEQKIRTRKFYAFDDIEAFLAVRTMYPHAHEIIFDRFCEKQQGRLMFDFDFEEPWYGISRTEAGFVPPDFHEKIEGLIKNTFLKFYDGVDVSKFQFIWLVSRVVEECGGDGAGKNGNEEEGKQRKQEESEKSSSSPSPKTSIKKQPPQLLEKWSKHLIVKNAYFASNWKTQTQMFYQLMLSLAFDEKVFPSMSDLEKLMDVQIARSNATMRMCGSTKFGKNKVLVMDGRCWGLESEEKKGSGGLNKFHGRQSFSGNDNNVPQDPKQPVRAVLGFYDTMVQLYKREDIETEQHINENQLSHRVLNDLALVLRKNEITEEVNVMPSSKTLENRFLKEAMKIDKISLEGPKNYSTENLTPEQVSMAVQCLKIYHEMERIEVPFKVKDVTGTMINLKRTSPGQCLLSGRVHEHENAYMLVSGDGTSYGAAEIRFYCHRGCKLKDRSDNFICIYRKC